MNLYCPHCAAKNEYSGVKPKTCKVCGKSTDSLAGFKAAPVQSAPPAKAAVERPYPSQPRKINRWGSEGNVVMSEDTYNLIISCNHELHDEVERLRTQLRKARKLPWWFELALSAACLLGWIAGAVR